MGYVITHPERGVYVGRSGFGHHWSMWDGCWQPSVVTYPNPLMAAQHIALWHHRDFATKTADYSFVWVIDDSAHDGDTYASVANLKRAGLGPLLGTMEADLVKAQAFDRQWEADRKLAAMPTLGSA